MKKKILIVFGYCVIDCMKGYVSEHFKMSKSIITTAIVVNQYHWQLEIAKVRGDTSLRSNSFVVGT